MENESIILIISKLVFVLLVCMSFVWLSITALDLYDKHCKEKREEALQICAAAADPSACEQTIINNWEV